MSSAEDTRNTQDLLFAALDQSGLTSFDCFSLPPGGADNSPSRYAANLTSQGTSLVADSTNSESDSNVGTLYPTTAVQTSSNASVLNGLNTISPTNCVTTASNTAAAASSTITPGKKNSYARITVGGRKFLIPLEKKNGALPRLVIPSFKASEASPLGGSGKLTTTGVGKAESNGKSSSVLTTSKRTIEVKPSLGHNLGSQFVESAGGLEDTTKRVKKDLKDWMPTGTETHQPKLILQNGVPKVGSSVASRPNSHTGTHMSTDARRKDNIVKPAMTGSYDELTEEEEQENEEVADTYEEYKPSKLSIGLPHPDAVVETSSLSSIPPPDVHYKLSLPEEPIDMGLLSALQLETITYACQKHLLFLPSGERGGFLIGDGAGVGKGRTIAGIIFENYLLGRKRALWFSVSNDLKYDCERDLRDIGAKNIQVHTLNKFKYGKISSRENSSVKKGVVFATYASLISESHTDSKYGTRLKQLLHWCGKEFDGVIIFDECHKAKNLVPAGSTRPTKTGFAVMELQRRLPKARIIYASATGASEPRNMAYMTRIGLWGKGTPFSDFGDFIQAVERRGVGAMELVAMDLKSRGAYIARQLSFHGVSFRIDEVKLPLDFAKMYNEAVRLWVAAREAFQVAADTFGAEYHMKKTMWGQFWAAHQRFFKYLCIAAKVNRTALLAREAVKHGKCVVIGLQSTGEARTLDQLDKCGGELDDFVSTARGVFENLVENHFPAPNRKRITDMFGKDFYKTEDPIKKSGQKRTEKKPSDYEKNCAQREQVNTFGESDSDDSVDYSDEDIEKIFGGESDSDDWGVDSDPKPKAKISKDKNSECGSNQTVKDEDVKPNIFSKSMNGEIGMIKHEKTVLRTLSLTGCDPIMKVQAIKEELLEKLESVNLPNNALDDLIDALGGPENVAEMTGRKGRVVLSDEGQIQYQSRAEKDVGCNLLNLTEKQRFMDGEKNIAIISEAASSGISLQSDRRVRNQRRRLHITLELPWSADRAIQQFGRTHRSNQVNAPEYVFLITELAGERRFASVVAKRLESLGALTHGDRRATETRDLSQYNFDNKYGRLALDSVMKSLIGLSQPLVPPPVKYPGDFYADIREAMLGVGLISSEAQSTNLQLEKESCSIVKFLNRILGIEVLQQNSVFEYFSQTLSFIVRRAKMEGQLDQGIKDIGSSRNLVHHVNCTRFELNNKIGCSGDGPGTNASYVELHTVKVERGLSWENAKTLLAEVHKDNNNGFYLSQSMRNRSHVALLCIDNTWGRSYSYSEDRKDKDKLFTIYRPNTGKQAKKETLGFILSKFQKATLDDTRGWWMKQYTTSLLSCSHVYFQGSCRTQNIPCIVGKRQLTYHILSGSVLAVWKMIEHVLATASPAFHKIQIVRFLTKDRGRLVGLLIPEHCLSLLTNFLRNSIPTFSHSSKAVTGKNWNSSYKVNHYANVFDEPDDEFSPDNFVSSVLFAANNPSS